MAGRQILHKMKEKVGFGTLDTGKGKSKISKNITFGHCLAEGKSSHAMEDFVEAKFVNVGLNELGLFAIYDGHLSNEVPKYLKCHLFDNILKQDCFWKEPKEAIKNAYSVVNDDILSKCKDLGKGGSTAVTAILINGQKLVVANVGDSRAVVCQDCVGIQLSVDHEPSAEKDDIVNRGGFVSHFPGDVPRVDGQLAVARAFGDKSLKEHLSSEPHIYEGDIDDSTDFLILASDGLWKVMNNQDAVNAIRDAKDAPSAAGRLVQEAKNRKSTDDISCVVVKFR